MSLQSFQAVKLFRIVSVFSIIRDFYPVFSEPLLTCLYLSAYTYNNIVT